jgi:hypothetical protein
VISKSVPSWGCDVPISMPEPIPDDENREMADMGTHIFTPTGLRINVNTDVLDAMFAPTYAPPQDPAG